eukprot:c8834_g1_i1.p1 GENE.c8834_g1_i1~~c8834_g1_i1.p1  ORF type:complete len:588 (-),score=179.27 c8834_g1_i1:70-1800(-)
MSLRALVCALCVATTFAALPFLDTHQDMIFLDTNSATSKNVFSKIVPTRNSAKKATVSSSNQKDDSPESLAVESEKKVESASTTTESSPVVATKPSEVSQPKNAVSAEKSTEKAVNPETAPTQSVPEKANAVPAPEVKAAVSIPEGKEAQIPTPEVAPEAAKVTSEKSVVVEKNLEKSEEKNLEKSTPTAPTAPTAAAATTDTSDASDEGNVVADRSAIESSKVEENEEKGSDANVISGDKSAWTTVVTPNTQDSRMVRKAIAFGSRRTYSNNPVDIVITWYNPDDPQAKASYDSRLQSIDQSGLAPGVTDSKRRTDAGELRYNLRAIEKNVPWVRHVFLVVPDDCTLPSWLDTSAPHLRIVRHNQIFSSSSYLPTFNSQAIESRLHYIPGLSEQFIYLNDDMFINQQVSKNTFFTGDGKARVWPGWCVTEQSNSHALSVKNSLRLMKGMTKKWTTDYTLHHHAKPLTISMMRESQRTFGDAWKLTETHPFRHKQDIWPILMASVQCVDSGKCVKETPPKSYSANIDTSVTPARAIQVIEQERPVLMCLNDSTASRAKALEAALAGHFSNKSRYEK